MVMLVWECDSIWYDHYLLNADPIEHGGQYGDENEFLSALIGELFFMEWFGDYNGQYY